VYKNSMKLYKERENRDVFGNKVINQWNNLSEEVINACINARSINMFETGYTNTKVINWDSNEYFAFLRLF